MIRGGADEIIGISVQSLSHAQPFVTLRTVAHKTPQFIEFFRQEYWSGLSFPFPGDLPNPGIEPGSPVLQADSLPTEPPGNRERNRVHNKWTALETSPNFPHPCLSKNCLPKKIPKVKEETASVFICPRLLA